MEELIRSARPGVRRGWSGQLDPLAGPNPSSVCRHPTAIRAFAAEFLAPAEALRQRLGGEQVSPDEVEDLACDFDVSGYVVRHQIENHNLAQIADW